MRFHLKRTVLWVVILLTGLIFIDFKVYDNSYLVNDQPLRKMFNQTTVGQTTQSNFTKIVSYLQTFTKRAVIKSQKLWATEAVKENLELLWPSREFYENDRITNQLNYRLGNESKSNNKLSDKGVKLKKIYLDSGFGGKRLGRWVFLEDKCNINTCEITRDRKYTDTADALFFQSSSSGTITRKSTQQIWMIFMLESPYHTAGLRSLRNVFNWTATYRHDSDIVAPYEKFVRYDEKVKFLPQKKSYAAGKTKKVAWFVSNCGARNERLQYARKLSKYIQVDIYGACGPLRCPRKNDKCFEMLNTDYKFYLSFENSNCRDYITEKFFVTGLQHDVIPIVMGAAPEDYSRAAPPHSFIHVDEFQSPEELAQYLHKLDQNDDLYNEYFRWKGTGSFINTYFWCRVCAMLHETSRESHAYRDLEKWWRGEGICIGKDNWRQRQRTSKYIAEDYLA
ncbi:glycoprotein 3-alpha-L-fucosyltransferase A-like [Mercenaria mercenaria]|uniref:glycoprotein 3-alpha-L-fucosyltransferase A-like n=1 Tax=Mercenaria mercenaria TaxID=6596 RepID=UPI00234E62CE|nr:glycoprotein 3-alpha-L-fucosyltransferase A-like [Mercenaria mercenaria]